MANKLESIAAKKKQAELAKQEAEVAAFARRVADELVGNITVDTSDDLKNSVAQLATTVAKTIVASNETFNKDLQDGFTKLLLAVQANKPNDSNLVKLNKDIGKSLAKFETALQNIEFAPTVNVACLKPEYLKVEVDKILAKLPASSKRDVSIAYEQATADKYINVRLTDGIKFYSAFAGGGGREGGATEAKQNAIITAIGNIGSVTNYTTRIVTVGTLTYIGNAAIGSATSAAVWQIKRLDETSGLIKLWADGNANFDNIWDNRASLSYS